LQDVRHSWDAGGNLSTRQDMLSSETETFSYDFIDRLTGVSGPYTELFTYNQIGNLLTKTGSSYTYGSSSHKHAVTTIGSTSYAYDANGNMTTRGTQTITWDVENRPLTVTGGATFVYDGDGNRVKSRFIKIIRDFESRDSQKTESSQTILYINKYYEKNLTTSVVTTNYYLGERLIATRAGTTLTYVHQDSLTGTSVTTNSSGTSTGSIKYFSFGATRSGTVTTARKFTGQRLDNTGLYYYGARYYDPTIGRFISADTLVPSPVDPQSLNRYSYCLNNPLKYTDPSGHVVEFQNEWWVRYCALNGYTSGDGWNAVAQPYVELNNAWNELSNAAPELTEKLETDSSSVIYISWADLPDNFGGLTWRSNPNSIIVQINTKLHDKFNTDTFAHEAFHALARLSGIEESSRLEEAYAYSYGQAAIDILGSPIDKIKSWINPYNDVRFPGDASYGYLKNSYWDRVYAYKNLTHFGWRPYTLRNLYVQYFPENKNIN
jgi:RHS repeat-associated protein